MNSRGCTWAQRWPVSAQKAGPTACVMLLPGRKEFLCQMHKLNEGPGAWAWLVVCSSSGLKFVNSCVLPPHAYLWAHILNSGLVWIPARIRWFLRLSLAFPDVCSSKHEAWRLFTCPLLPDLILFVFGLPVATLVPRVWREPTPLCNLGWNIFSF